MKALIISAGLMGGSIAKALVQKGWEVHATARKPLEFNGITFYTDFQKIPNLDFDIICICSPRGRRYEIYEEMFAQTSRISTKNTFIVDISSVQNQNNLFQLKYPNFVPCHPIAGSEKTGFENSSPEILKGKKCLVIHRNPPQAVLNFWHSCGMIVDNSITSCMEHDRIFAKVSHLPQLISFNLPPEEKSQYKEFYRLKNSSREIWDEIFLHNRSWIAEALHEYRTNAFATFVIKRIGFVHYESAISDTFLKITTEKERQYAGTGFKTIASASTERDLGLEQEFSKEWIKLWRVFQHSIIHLTSL